MSKRTAVFLLFFLTALSQYSCHKDRNTNEDDQQFCACVAEKNFDGTGPFIDIFLATLHNASSDENLEKLCIWLESKACIDSVKIICNSCIKTLPPQSELSVSFTVDGKPLTLILDILMDNPLHFRTFHE